MSHSPGQTDLAGFNRATIMSEYQYYEFQKVDGSLTEMEMHELRGYSSRARITSASFVNEYNFGSFKGNSAAWMEKYFDGFLYLANWGSRELQLALPAKLLTNAVASRYCNGEAASCRTKAGKLILAFRSEDESGDDCPEGDGQLASLLQIRNELAGGDLRSLYLGWLLGVQGGAFDNSVLEPPVPPNLTSLSGAQKSFVEFLRVEPDLLAVAAQNSPRAKVESATKKELAAWVAALTAQEKDKILVQLMEGNADQIGQELQSRFRQQRNSGKPVAEVKRRTVGELRDAAML
jgi:hypothetical protein